MIAALVIANLCLVARMSGVPDWLGVILCITYNICYTVAYVIWGRTKERIERIEDKITKKGGRSDGKVY